MVSKQKVATAIHQAEENGLVQTGQIGGQPKQRYWTPDGSVIFAMPDIHEYAQMSGGKIVAQGLRDANLDRGWLLAKPTKLQVHCGGCDKWHPTQKEVDACIKKKTAYGEKWNKAARRQLKQQPEASGDVAELKAEMKELKSMFSKVLEKLGG